MWESLEAEIFDRFGVEDFDHQTCSWHAIYIYIYIYMYADSSPQREGIPMNNSRGLFV